MKKGMLIGLLAGLGAVVFFGVMTWQMMGNRQNRVEVCMGFQGQTACKVASGPTKDEAQRTATDTACALIAVGMSETQQCSHAEPLSVKWLD